MIENMTSIPTPMSKMPGFDAMQKQQQAFLKAMTGGWGPGSSEAGSDNDHPSDDLDDIRKQLAELQSKLSRMEK